MAETKPDITIPTTEFVSLNSLSSLAVGTAMSITNKGGSTILLIESSTKPSDSSTDGIPVTPLSEPYAVADVDTGALEIWAKALSFPCKVSVQ